MAASTMVVPSLPLRRSSCTSHSARTVVRPVPVMSSTAVPSRRQLALLLPATAAALALRELPAGAEDIGLFGELRKRLRSAEQEAEPIVREGFEAAEKGIQKAGKGIVAAER